MRCCLIVTLSSLLVNASTSALAHPVRQGNPSAVGRAWEFMETGMSMGVPELLDRHQPPPILPELRTRVTAALPSEGELTATPIERVKLAAADPVLKIYRRLGSVSLKVVDVPYALVALHGRAVLLVTREALSLITVREFQAIIAHELAHELFWDDYDTALKGDQYDQLQELELRCDGVGVMILRALGVDSAHLARAAVKLTRHNERRGGALVTARQVPLDVRLTFIRNVDSRLRNQR
jgi:hypothetical protein